MVWSQYIASIFLQSFFRILNPNPNPWIRILQSSESTSEKSLFISLWGNSSFKIKGKSPHRHERKKYVNIWFTKRKEKFKLKNAIWRQWFCLKIFPYDQTFIYLQERSNYWVFLKCNRPDRYNRNSFLAFCHLKNSFEGVFWFSTPNFHRHLEAFLLLHVLHRSEV